ncbi:MAG: DNA polymerase III subunit alpha [Verrucomicrobiota bacterium]|nr:DNA polymerase III subunit alpha [Verrucomicrobiota bacterium]
MKTTPFVHLHLHTKYSLLDGACHLDQVMDTALANGMPAVAITDHGGMFGVIDFYKTALAKGVKPIIGCEVYVARRSRFERKGAANNPSDHLVLLAANDTGYHNLIRLVSLAHLEGFYYKPRVDKELLARHAGGLIALSACLKGEVASRLVEEGEEAALRAACEHAEIFGRDKYFLEIQDHGIEEQVRVNAAIRNLSLRTGIPLVATNDVHYLKKEHAPAHEVLLCLQTQTVMRDPKRMRYPTHEFYMKTRAEMERRLPGFTDAIDCAARIADRCNVELEFGRLHFPTFEAPMRIERKDYLVSLGMEGIRRRYGVPDPAHPRDERERQILDRFRGELAVIEKTGFVNYFLVVWDFVRFAHERHIPVGPGRGSGGGSLVAYVLGITAIEPLRYGLIFERFLNSERVSPPDFDIDFCQARRGEVIEYVKNKYGRENVAQIATFNSLGARNVIRDVGRVLEIPYTKCDLIAKLVPEDPKMTLRKALELNPEFRRTYETDPGCRRILDYGFVLEGLYRNLATHAAGVVIGEKPLIEIAPLACGKEDEVVTQYAMEPLGALGLLKMDFLGLKTLTVIQEALDLIRTTQGKTLDLDALVFDDKPTYGLLNRGDTVGVFQLESSGMRDLIRRVGIDKIEDLIAMIALFRPGPMNMLEDYVNRKTGRAKVHYAHDLLRPILEETCGVMIYQEQVLKAANVLAGYSLAEGDILRRAMSKKKAGEMAQQRAKFIAGCARLHGIRVELADGIFAAIEKFAGYGFNKSHSAAYAVVAYQTAYLKANFPAEFMAALLSSEIGNADKLPVFTAEAENMGLRILPPDVNASQVRFTPSDGTVRFGLAGIKNVGTDAADAVVRERAAAGPYAGLVSFCDRIDPQFVNKKVIEAFVKSGAFDSVERNRARLFNGIDFAMARAAAVQRDRRSGQISLFDRFDIDRPPAETEALPEVKPWSESELLAGEKELLGVYMSGHPLTRYKPLLERYQLAAVESILKLEDGAYTRLGGIIARIIRKIVKQSKEDMVVLTLDDLGGSIEVVVWPDIYRKYRDLVVQDAAVLVCGQVSRRGPNPNLIAQEIYPLADAPKHLAARLSIHVPAVHLDDDKLERIRQILSRHPGRIPVVICLQFPSGEKVFLETDIGFHVMADMELIHNLEALLGERSVYVATHRATGRENRATRDKWRSKPA